MGAIHSEARRHPRLPHQSTGSARLERCRGWVELRELDVAAESMAVRAIDDAIKHGGLLKKAITQLVLNFQMAGRQAKYVGGSFASLYP